MIDITCHNIHQHSRQYHGTSAVFCSWPAFSCDRVDCNDFKIKNLVDENIQCQRGRWKARTGRCRNTLEERRQVYRCWPETKQCLPILYRDLREADLEYVRDTKEECLQLDGCRPSAPSSSLASIPLEIFQHTLTLLPARSLGSLVGTGKEIATQVGRKLAKLARALHLFEEFPYTNAYPLDLELDQLSPPSWASKQEKERVKMERKEESESLGPDSIVSRQEFVIPRLLNFLLGDEKWNVFNAPSQLPTEGTTEEKKRKLNSILNLLSTVLRQAEEMGIPLTMTSWNAKHYYTVFRIRMLVVRTAEIFGIQSLQQTLLSEVILLCSNSLK